MDPSQYSSRSVLVLHVLGGGGRVLSWGRVKHWSGDFLSAERKLVYSGSGLHRLALKQQNCQNTCFWWLRRGSSCCLEQHLMPTASQHFYRLHPASCLKAFLRAMIVGDGAHQARSFRSLVELAVSSVSLSTLIPRLV